MHLKTPTTQTTISNKFQKFVIGYILTSFTDFTETVLGNVAF